ncbi:SusC/RagA family TonB-linked outer membrane protein [Pseudopedobacter beijingensis]
MQVSAASYAQKVTLNKKNANLVEVLKEIRKQTGYYFIYTNEVIENSKPIDINVKDKNIQEVLGDILAGQGVDYSVKDQSVVLKLSTVKQDNSVTVKGKIISEDDKQPVIGASITMSGNRHLGVTDANGQFNIKVNKGVEVTFSSIGFVSQKRVFTNNENNVTITFKVDNKVLSEVVVTALGIKREEKALGYAVTQVTGEQLTDALSNNWTDALSGKVAGLNLVRSGGGPSGSNKIILRGENNLTGDNEALIVVDGVVINQGSGRATGTGHGAYLSDDSPVDFGTGLNDINPEDIESVSVLKGPGASALYGQRGANGAVIITTKSGKPRAKGIGVTINSNTSLQTISRWPDYQYEYGQGLNGDDYYSYLLTADGPSTKATSSAWGPKFDGQYFFQYDPVTHTTATERTPWVAYPNNRKGFFDTGRTFTNSVTLDGGTARTSVRFSLTNVDNTWIIPNTGYKRNTLALSASQKATDKLQISTKINYTNKWSDNLPSTGYNNQSIMYWNIAWVPNADIDWLKDYWMPGQENIKQSYPFSSYPDNPYLIANQMLNKSNRNGITGNVQATYNFTSELSLMVKTSLDFAYESRSQQRPYDTEKFRKGMYRTQGIFSQEMSSDFLIKYDKKINSDIKVTVSGGGSTLKNSYIKDELRADSLLYPGVYTLANKAGVLEALPYRSNYIMNSFYGLGTFAYKDYLFVDVTARNDWNSVLATPTSTKNVSFFYPSMNVSAVISDMFQMPASISFAKVRASIAKVGSGLTTPYTTSYSYMSESNFIGGLSNPTRLPNEDLKPLKTISYEVGTDVRLFKNRLGIDLSLYKSDTKDQILYRTIDRAAGGSTAVANAGLVRNKGIELALNGSPLKSKKGLNWNINATFAANKNSVVSLVDTSRQMTLQVGPGSRGAINATVGGSMGDLYGLGYNRAPGGQIIYVNGYPTLTTDLIYIGNTNPQWKAGLNNQFKYRQFALNFLLDGQYGAKAFSLTARNLSEQGKLKTTLPGRYNGIIGNGVVANGDGTYSPNTQIAGDVETYYKMHYGGDNVEGASYSTDFIKLREARLTYQFSAKLVKKMGVQKANIAFYGRDLFMVTSWPGFDPEFGTLGNGDINKGFEIGQFPATSTFGLNLIVGF